MRFAKKNAAVIRPSVANWLTDDGMFQLAGSNLRSHPFFIERNSDGRVKMFVQIAGAISTNEGLFKKVYLGCKMSCLFYKVLLILLHFKKVLYIFF